MNRACHYRHRAQKEQRATFRVEVPGHGLGSDREWRWHYVCAAHVYRAVNDLSSIYWVDMEGYTILVTPLRLLRAQGLADDTPVYTGPAEGAS